MTHANFLPNVGPFHRVSRQREVGHGIHGRYRVVLYGAYNAFGPVDPKRNGVAILIEPRDGARGAVVVDELGQEAIDLPVPSDKQIELYESIIALPWKLFQALVNRSDRKRFKL